MTDKTNPTAITWLDSTLPESTAAYETDADDLGKLRDEVRILEDELNRESERNTELQRAIVTSRTRNDEMVSMMQLLRSETEAVLERHNLVMETPEARAKSAELHKKLVAEEKLKNPSAGEEEKEEEGESSSSGEEEQVCLYCNRYHQLFAILAKPNHDTLLLLFFHNTTQTG